MWTVKHYVDDFGAPTKAGYVSNTELIAGTFSNTATQNSPLLVRLLIDKNLDAGIQLYEYAHANPVKGDQGYVVLVKDSAGKTYRLYGFNHDSDRLTLRDKHAKLFHEALLKGGKVQVVINEMDTPTTEYHFTIDNAGGYLNARKELKKS